MSRGFRHSVQLLLAWVLLVGSVAAVEKKESVFIDGPFISLTRWQSFTFPNISMPSQYRLAREDEVTCLHMESEGGASALVLNDRFNVYEWVHSHFVAT